MISAWSCAYPDGAMVHCCSLVLSWAPHPHPALHLPIGPHLCALLWSLASLHPHAAPPGIPLCSMAGWAIHPLVPIRQEALGCQHSEPTGPSPNREGPRTGLQHCKASSIATQLCPCGLSSPDTQQTMRLATQCPTPNATLRRQQPWATTRTLLNLGLLPDPKSNIATLDFHVHQGQLLTNKSTLDPCLPSH